MARVNELIATCWTNAGDCDPLSDARSPVPIRERVEAAAQAGFTGFGIEHRDLPDVERELGYTGFRTLLDDNGIVNFELEFLQGWYADGEERRKSDVQRADLFRAAEALGARHIKIAGDLAGGAFDRDRMIDNFGPLAEQAAQAGTRLALEPMPFADVKTPQMGLEVVQAVDHPAGGLCIDVWHVARADIPYQTLETFPVEYVVHAELDDAPAEMAHDTMLEETFLNRLFPGEGAFDVPAFVGALTKAGYQGTWGVEILSEHLRTLPVTEMTRRAYETGTKVLAAAD